MSTIAAIATPIGSGGIGIIRVSGELAVPIASKVFVPFSSKRSDFIPFRLHYGDIIDPDTLIKLDEVLVAFMKGPRSYTCEDVIEIHSHSNAWVMKEILELVLKHGAVLAEPGEFTKRAFLNGRIDLTRAEAVCDIISAKSAAAVNSARLQLDGKLHNSVNELIKEINDVHSFLEAAIDFSDETENDQLTDHRDLIHRLEKNVINPIRQYMATHECAVYLKDGVKIAIVGQPNVGKSSLMNRLIEKDRSIVTDLPGTTRDIIQDHMMIRGIPVSLFDTAGLHETDHPVEKIGILKTEDQLDQSDIVLFVVDVTEISSPQNRLIFNRLQKKRVILVLNKVDLVEEEHSQLRVKEFMDIPFAFTSAKTNHGIDTLKDAIEKSITTSCQIIPGETLIPNLRHHQAFSRTEELMTQAISSLQDGYGGEVAAIDLEEAKRHLKAIVGEFDRSDVLENIFSQFCLGK